MGPPSPDCPADASSSVLQRNWTIGKAAQKDSPWFISDQAMTIPAYHQLFDA